MPGIDLDAAQLLAKKLRLMLEQQPFTGVGQVTASFGVADYTSGDNPASLIKKLDRCLYQAKAGGRNRVEVYTVTPPTLDD